jgi:hypothetical protein
MAFEMSDKTQVVTVYHISDDTGSWWALKSCQSRLTLACLPAAPK